MDGDDLLPKRSDDPLVLLVRQDLDPFSVEELQARVTALEAEIDRTQSKIQFSVNHKSTADALFKR
jgi:uncharacterized small protein (DUF1192 family)